MNRLVSTENMPAGMYIKPYDNDLLVEFLRESNKIEGILRYPSDEEIEAAERFMALEKVTVDDLQKFVSVCEPSARLRDCLGLNVRVGNHYPPKGGPDIRRELECILMQPEVPFVTHVAYERLHPFTDCNGRSGRMLWAWQTRDLSLGFLHRYYYQSLSGIRGEL
jgi:hypothetical protein